MSQVIQVSRGIRLRINLANQTLCVLNGDAGRAGSRKTYPVSTAANGPGEVDGSGCTPRGAHIIRAKIGGGQPINTIFIGRRACGVYQPGMREMHPDRDWILTRILWLSGCQPGFNRLGRVDTMRRYIYIHGAPDDVALGKPGSSGCIRMRNRDLLALYDMVTVGTSVTIHA